MIRYAILDKSGKKVIGTVYSPAEGHLPVHEPYVEILPPTVSIGMLYDSSTGLFSHPPKKKKLFGIFGRA